MGLSWHSTALLHIALGEHEAAWELARQDYRVFFEVVSRHPGLVDEALAATTGQAHASDMIGWVVDGLTRADVERGLALADQLLSPTHAAGVRERARNAVGSDLSEQASRLAERLAAGGRAPSELDSDRPYVRLHAQIVLGVAERSMAALGRALEDAAALENPAYRAPLVSSAVEGMAVLDPDEALGLVRGPRWNALPDHDEIIAAVGNHLVPAHPEAALELVATIVDDEIRELAHFDLAVAFARASSPLLDRALAGITWAGIRAEAHAAIGVIVAGTDPVRARQLLDTALALRTDMTSWDSPI